MIDFNRLAKAARMVDEDDMVCVFFGCCVFVFAIMILWVIYNAFGAYGLMVIGGIVALFGIGFVIMIIKHYLYLKRI